ncbi:hypothetical protein V6N13_021624 [Hibiscus sabdariffa]|uniref:DUF4005 domain-containing protein n=1 Tax=Hibiscus sabdariffa TaxID=183260 RepID=A0ABR2B9S4_9ROSI
MKWLDRWMATKPCESPGWASTDKRDSIKEPLRLRLASTRCLREEICHYSAANSPSLAKVPNYMVVTEYARANARSRSTPRQRPVNSEKDRGGRLAKKKLSYHCGHIL